MDFLRTCSHHVASFSPRLLWPETPLSRLSPEFSLLYSSQNSEPWGAELAAVSPASLFSISVPCPLTAATSDCICAFSPRQRNSPVCRSLQFSSSHILRWESTMYGPLRAHLLEMVTRAGEWALPTPCPLPHTLFLLLMVQPGD